MSSTFYTVPCDHVSLTQRTLSAMHVLPQDGGPGGKTVRARVCRKVDGLDTHLFEKALEVTRAFLADPAYGPS